MSNFHFRVILFLVVIFVNSQGRDWIPESNGELVVLKIDLTVTYFRQFKLT